MAISVLMAREGETCMGAETAFSVTGKRTGPPGDLEFEHISNHASDDPR
jgi:hypothetical protein